MFGFVMANTGELDPHQQQRYSAVYCGICRQIRIRASQGARLGLRYDMAFLALLLMSLYEPEEAQGERACGLHPVKPRSWIDNAYIQYAADMNVALAYYKALDDYQDEKKLSAKALSHVFASGIPQIRSRFPRQCDAIDTCLQQLHALEKADCQNPDEPASCFGTLMGELLVYEEDLWSGALRQMGMALGRFIYLADAAVDYRRDMRKKQYNPFLSMGCSPDAFEEHLVLAMARCTDYYERLPLVQDKALLDNILYSGVWIAYRAQRKSKSSGGTA